SARPPALPPGRWWSARVDELTGRGPSSGRVEPADRDGAAGDSLELLRRITGPAGGGDRDGLRRQLRTVRENVGLGLAGVAQPMLHRLAGELLGHPPGRDDLARLRARIGGPARDLLPELPAEVVEALLARVCRVPPPAGGRPAHPADPAVAAGVLAGVLLARLGRDAADAAAQAPQPAPAARPRPDRAPAVRTTPTADRAATTTAPDRHPPVPTADRAPAARTTPTADRAATTTAPDRHPPVPTTPAEDGEPTEPALSGPAAGGRDA
ncbi:MAG TPA: hypothetical protein VNV66_16735, partial [Pilimelia sp.]|nr:hypothetical protein [Pilimelia sp.]